MKLPARRARRSRSAACAAAALATLALQLALPPSARAQDAAPVAVRHGAAAQVGIASVYSHRLAGRLMANGAPLRLDRHHAASRSLPLGSVALVTNLRNGARALVTITDRGPFIRGRIIDLSPLTAKQLGFDGLARVQVAPVAPDAPAADAPEPPAASAQLASAVAGDDAPEQ